MTNGEYQHLMSKAFAYMQTKNDAAWKKWSLQDYPRFDWDQKVGTIVFSDPSRKSVAAHIQFIGSWSQKPGTWMWAWANDSVGDKLKIEVAEVRDFGILNGLTELTDAVWEGPIEAAWDMTSLSCYILQSDMA